MSASNPPPAAEEETDLTPEDEDEILRRCAESEEAEDRGELIPWEALFPPQRLTG